MSWSVQAVGTPAGVKRALRVQFEEAKKENARAPHLHESICLAEKLVDHQLNFYKQCKGVAVQAEAYGWAYMVNGTPASSQLEVKVKPLYGYFE